MEADLERFSRLERRADLGPPRPDGGHSIELIGSNARLMRIRRASGRLTTQISVFGASFYRHIGNYIFEVLNNLLLPI